MGVKRADKFEIPGKACVFQHLPAAATDRNHLAGFHNNLIIQREFIRGIWNRAFEVDDRV